MLRAWGDMIWRSFQGLVTERAIPFLRSVSLMKAYTWTPKVCRIIAFCGFWAIILPTFEGLGKGFPASIGPET